MEYLKCAPGPGLRRLAPLALAVTLVGACGCGGAARDSVAAGAPFTTDRVWDDGKAEVSVYDGSTQAEGVPRPVAARMIVVKEDLQRATLVKSDAGPVPGKTVEAIKFNFIADFTTGAYVWHEMASVFFDRGTLDVLKETMSHTEACGITWVRVGPKDGRLVHEAHSYWDGEADRETPVTWPDDRRPHVYADAMPVWLRAWAGERTPREWQAWMVPGQISGRSPLAATRPLDAIIRRSDGGPLQVPAGRFETVKFAVAGGRGTDLYWFDAAAPHLLLMMETAAGRKLTLRRAVRLDYWKHTAAGDEKLLE